MTEFTIKEVTECSVSLFLNKGKHIEQIDQIDSEQIDFLGIYEIISITNSINLE